MKVVSETENEITREFDDGTTGRAACLVGADGIHCSSSKVLVPKF